MAHAITDTRHFPYGAPDIDDSATGGVLRLLMAVLLLAVTGLSLAQYAPEAGGIPASSPDWHGNVAASASLR